MTRSDKLQTRIDKIRSSVYVEDLIALTFPLVGRGRRLEAKEHGSLAVWPDSQKWKWFSMGEDVGGDIFDWVMYTQNVSFMEALRILEEDEGIFVAQPERRERVELPKVDPPWRVNAEATLAEYRNRHRFTLWPKYKAVTDATIERFDLGVGQLHFQDRSGNWYRSRADFLTVPIFFRGELVAVKGRTLSKKAWICNTGSDALIWNADSIEAGSVVWLCENYVDAMLLMQLHPEWIGVATGGARGLMEQEAAYIRERSPSLVIVAYDNDLVGQARDPLLSTLREEWQAEQVARITERTGQAPTTLPKPPSPTGPTVCNQLQALGVKSLLFEWPEDAPPKYDVGAHIARMEQAQ